jgi:hypothetical protein
MAITRARAAIGRIFYQRCFYLCLVLLTLVIGVPFIEPTPVGRFAVNFTGVVVIIAAVAAIGRTVVVRHRAAPTSSALPLAGITAADAHWTLVVASAPPFTPRAAYLLLCIPARR